MDYFSDKNEKQVEIPVKDGKISGILTTVITPKGIVIFAHGSGSSRFSQRNKFVAKILQDNNLSTLLFDLLTPKEEIKDNITAEYRFNINLLSERLCLATQWVKDEKETKHLPIGYYGASTGAAAALISATKLKKAIKAIVSRGGRPDLAENQFKDLVTPTLLIVGGNDTVVIDLNKKAYDLLTCIKKFEIILGATHLFEEPHKLEEVAELSAKWFIKHLK